ncbi:M4 family metallopeptidase [Roseateles sp. P5_E1]
MLVSVCTVIGSAQAQSPKSPASAKVESLVRASAQLAMVSDDESLDVRDVIQDANGDSHTRFHRKYKGLRVIGGDFVAHAQASGVLKGVTHEMREHIRVNVKPTQNAGAAEARVRTVFGGAIGGVVSELVIYAIGAPVLAYDVLVSAGVSMRRHYIVDAHGLNLINQWDDVHSGSGPVSTTGSSQYSGVVPLTIYYQIRDQRTGNWYALRDIARGPFSISADSVGSALHKVDNGQAPNTLWAGANVDAMYGQNISWDYFLTKFGRNGGSANFAYFDSSMGSNAEFNPDCWCIRVGLGDGAGMQSFAAPDVMGHEYTHGIIRSTANLIYSGESGAINESMADVFGTLIEYYAPYRQYPANYMIGERVYSTNNGNSQPLTYALRYMFRPSYDGRGSQDCYYPGIGSLDVHYSSGVGNRFFYLLAEGAVSPANLPGGNYFPPSSLVCNGDTALQGIGREAAGQIIYRALTVYMISSSGYSQYRAASIQAAIDLYGLNSTQYNAVIAAWSAAGVN